MLSRIRIGVIAILAMALSGCDGAVDKINEHLLAARGDLQAKRAITLSQDALKDLKRVDIALAIRAESLVALKQKLLDELNASEKIKSEKISFQNIDFLLDEQMLSLSLAMTKKVSDYNVIGQLQVSSFVGATANALVWNLYVDGIKVTRVEGVPTPVDQAVKLIADALDAARPIINAALDELVNGKPEKAVMLSLDQKDLIRKELSDESTNDFKVDSKELRAAMQAKASAVLIDKRGIFVISEIEFVKNDDLLPLKPAFPKESDLLRMSSSDRKKLVDAYREKVGALARGSEDLQPLLKFERSGVAVTREAVTRLINFLFSQGDVSGTLIMNKPMKEEKTELKFEIKRRNCSEYFAGCDFKDVCEGDRCTEAFDQVTRGTCQVGCCLLFDSIIPGGSLICMRRGTCNEPCDKVTKATRPIQSAKCDAFRAASTLHGGALCNVASNVSKAACDVDKNVRKSICDVEQAAAQYFESNPVATVKANAKPDVGIKLKVSNASVASDLASFQATVKGAGDGKLNASINYDRHFPTEALVLGPGVSLGAACVVDWKESIEIDVAAQPLTEPLTFAASSRNDAAERTAELEFKQQGSTTVKVDFDPPPLLALFAGKPHVTLNCPLAALGAVIFASGERIFTQEEARKLLPLLTGKGYPLEIKDLKFSIKLKPIKVCDNSDSCEKPLLTLDPEIKNRSITYVERRP